MSDKAGERKFDFESKLVCDVWNAALEAAGRELEKILDAGSTYPGRLGPELIRKLKK